MNESHATTTLSTPSHPFWPDRDTIRPGQPAHVNAASLRDAINPFDLRPLCPSCQRPTRQGIDSQGTWVFVDHPDASNPKSECSGSWQPVSRSAYDDAERVIRLTSVHTEESTYPPAGKTAGPGRGQPLSRLEAAFRHSGWANVRRRVHDALIGADVPLHRKTAFETCGSHAWVARSLTTPGDYKVVSSHCHDRFCVPCALDRAAVIRSNLRKHLAERRKAAASPAAITLRMMTLTIKTTPTEPLRGSLDDLAQWFKTLRKTRLWKETVRGGVAILELKYFRDTKRWHPHLHVIWEGSYIPHADLKATWSRITTRSYICHLKQIRNDDQAVHYLSGYVTKVMDGSYSHDKNLIREAIEALTGRKLIATFGSWHKVALLKRVVSGDWAIMVPLTELVRRAKAGDHEYRRIYALLKSRRVTATGESTKTQRAPPCVRTNANQTLLPF